MENDLQITIHLTLYYELALRLAFEERLGRSALNNPRFNNPIFKLNLNRF